MAARRKESPDSETGKLDLDLSPERLNKMSVLFQSYDQWMTSNAERPPEPSDFQNVKKRGKQVVLLLGLGGYFTGNLRPLNCCKLSNNLTFLLSLLNLSDLLVPALNKGLLPLTLADIP